MPHLRFAQHAALSFALLTCISAIVNVDATLFDNATYTNTTTTILILSTTLDQTGKPTDAPGHYVAAGLRINSSGESNPSSTGQSKFSPAGPVESTILHDINSLTYESTGDTTASDTASSRSHSGLTNSSSLPNAASSPTTNDDLVSVVGNSTTSKTAGAPFHTSDVTYRIPSSIIPSAALMSTNATPSSSMSTSHLSGLNNSDPLSTTSTFPWLYSSNRTKISAPYHTAGISGTGSAISNSSGPYANATGVDACWDSWTDYWDAPTPGTYYSELSGSPTKTNYLNFTETDTYTTTIMTASPFVFTVTDIETDGLDDGGFTITSVYTSFSTGSFTTIPISTSSGTETWTWSIEDPDDWDDFWTTEIVTATPEPPHCRLPSPFVSCQQEWEDWVTVEKTDGFGSGPACTQASITGSWCSSLTDQAVTLAYNRGFAYPISSELAPGCNAGCGRCAVTGGTIELLYFPPGLTPATDGPVIATTLNTTLTSPTMYISLASVYASGFCGLVGSTKGATILPVPPGEMSSAWATISQYSGTPSGCGIVTGTAPFNVTDLVVSPVPYSIYQSAQCWSTGPYNPIIVVPTSILNALDPAWTSCYLDFRGLYDPPRPLTPATVIAGPSTTAPGAPVTTPATPASGPASQAANTSPPATTPTQLPITEGFSSGPKVDPAPSAVSTSAGVAHTSVADPQLPDGAATKTSANPNDPAAQVSSALQAKPIKSASSADPAGAIVSVLEAVSTTAASQADPAGAIVSALEATTAQGVTLADPAGQILSSALETFASQPGAVGSQGSNAAGSGSATDPPIVTAAAGPASGGSAGSPGAVVVNGQTLQPGQSTSINGQPVSAGNGVVVIAGSTVTPSPTTAAAVIAGQTFAIGSAVTTASGVLVNGENILPGETATINGVAVVGGNGYVVIAGSTISSPLALGTTVIDGQTFTIEPASDGGSDPAEQLISTENNEHPDATVISIDLSLIITATAGQPLIVAGQTIAPGDPAITVSGHVLSMTGTNLVIDDTLTVSINAAGATGNNAVDGSVTTLATVNGDTFDVVEDPAASYAVVDGTTLLIGGPASVIHGQMVSAVPGGVKIGSSLIIPAATLHAAVSTATIDGHDYTIVEGLSGQTVVVNGVTFSVGGAAATIDGQIVTAIPGGVDIGTSTITGFTGGDSNGASSATGAAVSNVGAASTKASSAGVMKSLSWVGIIIGLITVMIML